MKYVDALPHLRRLEKILDGDVTIMIEEIFRPELCISEELPNMKVDTSVRGKSGIYFITDDEENILYIGKAVQRNFHERIWDHLKTDSTDGSCRYFPQNKFKQYGGLCERTVELVSAGKVKIRAVAISPDYFTSLAEVYLQTIHHHREGRLPALNRQIG